MTDSNSYVQQLEQLISNKLLPAYYNWCAINGIDPDIDESIVKKLKQKTIAKLFLPKPQNDHNQNS